MNCISLMESNTIVKKLLLSALFSIIVSTGYSEPPKKVIESCREDKAIDSTVKFKTLWVMYNIKNEDVKSICPKEQYKDIIGVKTHKRFFYQEHCDSKEYFLANKRRFSLEKSISHSLSPEIEPYGVGYHSQWYLITYKNKKYICMSSGVGENGWAAAATQYYVVENAFDEHLPLKAYFYFFDKEFIDIVRARGWTNG